MTNKKMKLLEGAEIIGFIQQTYDYDKFKIHPKNRRIRKEKVEAIKKSMQEKYILNPILVDDKGYIHDGQHRYTASMELGLPVIFIVDDTLDDRSMEILNNNETKSHWTHEDFLEKYIKEEKYDYILFDKIIKKYKLNFSDLMYIICEISEYEDIGEREALVRFDEGKFKFEENCHDYVIDFLEELSLFDKYNWSRHTSFVRVLFRLYAEEFYDKKYIRKRIDICEFKLKKEGRRSTIAEYGTFIADEFYTDTKRGIRVMYDIDSGEFHNVGKQGRPKKRKFKKTA